MNITVISSLVTASLFLAGVVGITTIKTRHWKRLNAELFKTDFAKTVQTVDILLPALLGVTIFLAILNILSSDGIARMLLIIATVCFVSIMGLSFALLVPLQNRIVNSAKINTSELSSMKNRWIVGHTARTIVFFIAFIIYICGIVIQN